MIRQVNGDIFKQNADIIAHQVNCKGVMGAGIARKIRKRISGKSFEQYRRYCQDRGALNLGGVFFCQALKPEGLLIANCFAQDGFGHFGCMTNYSALKSCMSSVLKYAEKHDLKTIAIPDHLGCGLAGGNWDVVTNKILKPLFDNSEVTLLISKL